MTTPPARSHPATHARKQFLTNPISRFGKPDHVPKTVRHDLKAQPQLAIPTESLRITYDQGELEIYEIAPSFYLKQLSQTALKGVSGIENIQNRVVVRFAKIEVSRAEYAVSSSGA